MLIMFFEYFFHCDTLVEANSPSPKCSIPSASIYQALVPKVPLATLLLTFLGSFFTSLFGDCRSSPGDLVFVTELTCFSSLLKVFSELVTLLFELESGVVTCPVELDLLTALSAVVGVSACFFELSDTFEFGMAFESVFVSDVASELTDFVSAFESLSKLVCASASVCLTGFVVTSLLVIREGWVPV